MHGGLCGNVLKSGILQIVLVEIDDLVGWFVGELSTFKFLFLGWSDSVEKSLSILLPRG